MNPALVTILGPDPRISAWIGSLVEALSALPEIPESALKVVESTDGGIAAFGLHLNLCPTGRAGEFRTVLKVSQALRDFGLALGAGDLDLHLVCKGHEAVSIGVLADPMVAGRTGNAMRRSSSDSDLPAVVSPAGA